MKLCFLRLWVMTELLLIKIGSIGIIRKTNPKNGAYTHSTYSYKQWSTINKRILFLHTNSSQYVSSFEFLIAKISLEKTTDNYFFLVNVDYRYLPTSFAYLP